MQNLRPKLYIVVPCYNESTVLPVTHQLFIAQLNKMIAEETIHEESKILYVNDGSKDDTWNIILELSEKDSHVAGISLSKNSGHQNALLAGLMESKDCCDITISIDCDGQDDITVIEEMVKEYLAGNEIVYGVRSNRDSDPFIKRFTAQSYYRLLEKLGGEEVIYNHADFRLISSRALEALSEFREVNLYLRGLIPYLGFNSTQVNYKRTERMGGKSRYSFSKMVELAVNGIVNLSKIPLHLITGFGVIIALVSFVGVIWAIVEKFMGNTVSGWASTTCIICFVSGIQLISMGIIGEYIGKIYMETKRRPRYIISEKVGL